MPTQTVEDQEQETKQPDQAEQNKAPVDPTKRRRGIILASIVGVLLVVGCVVWWLYSRTYESTDDAQADAHLNPISARVEGTVKAVYVEDNQAVRAGQPLVDLDTSDLEVKLAQAQADYDQAVAQLNAESPNVPITQTSNSNDITSQQEEVRNADASLSSAVSDYESSVAKLRQAEANNEKSQTDLVRYKELLDKQEIAHSGQREITTGQRELGRRRRRIFAEGDRSAECAVGPTALEALSDFSQCAPSDRNQESEHRKPQSQRGVLQGSVGSGSAQCRLLSRRGASQRHRDATKRRDRSAECSWYTTAGYSASGGPLGDRKLQGNAVAQDAPGPACERQDRRSRRSVQGEGRSNAGVYG